MQSYKRTPLSVEVNKVMKMLITTLFIMLVTLSVYFFAYMSGNAEKGSVVRENQLKLQTLESENRLLKEQVLEAQSIETIHTSDEISDMKTSEHEQYVKPLEPISRDSIKKSARVVD